MNKLFETSVSVKENSIHVAAIGMKRCHEKGCSICKGKGVESSFVPHAGASEPDAAL